MPDICMCEGKDCPKKETCYRFKAEPSEYRQAYFVHEPYDHEAEECEHYWPVRESEEKKAVES